MQVVSEGELIATRQDIEYDYLEIKYSTTTHSHRAPFIIVPVTYPRESTEVEMHRPGKSHSLEAINISSDEQLPEIGEWPSTDSRSDSAFDYTDAVERCLLLNYVRRSRVAARSGALGFEEFSDFRVSEDSIVCCESFMVQKPFAISEHFCGTHRTLRITRRIAGDIEVSALGASVIAGKDEYRVYGSGAIYTISCGNVNYTFPSQFRVVESLK